MPDLSRHTGLVHWQAKRYTWCKAPYDDLVQEGMMGLVIARDKFDPAQGVKFSTYATYWVRAKIQRFAQYYARDSMDSLDQEDQYGRLKVESVASRAPQVQTEDLHSAKLLATLPSREQAILERRFNLASDSEHPDRAAVRARMKAEILACKKK
jgi:RNA polymerase sigma factor (sigma-70 family)